MHSKHGIVAFPNKLNYNEDDVLSFTCSCSCSCSENLRGFRAPVNPRC